MILLELVEPALELVPNATAAATIRAMLDRKIDVGVVLEQKHPRGVVTEKELVERLAALPELEAAQLHVTDVMRPVETAPLSTETVDAARLMRERRAHHLALTEDDGSFRGMVGLRRILMEVMDEQELKLDNLERELMADGPGG
jgi:CBS domain-containing protein